MDRSVCEHIISPDYENLLAACASLSEAETLRIERLLSQHGIASEFIEYSGNVAQISLSDRIDILQIKGVNLLNGAQLDANKLDLQNRVQAQSDWLSILPPVVVLSEGGHNGVTLRLAENDLARRWQCCILSEDGTEFVQSFVPADLTESGRIDFDGEQYSARELLLWPIQTDAPPVGYHRLSLRCTEIGCSDDGGYGSGVPLIYAPARSFEPDWVLEGKRLWGFSVQLYSLRSSRNWGIGDFTDLEELIELAAGKGADFLTLNPLHAIDLNAVENCSPYSPNDRRRLNILYIDPSREADLLDCETLLEQVNAQSWQQKLETLRHLDAVDYRAVTHIKRDVLAQMFRHFLSSHVQSGSERGRAFEQFVRQQGESLQAFAAFEVACHRPVNSNDAETDVRFTLYVQWLAELQLARCQSLALAKGMRIGLIRDLAVGGDGSGAEVSLNAALFCQDASIGAPPDPLAPQGQNWGLPPIDPVVLRNSAYQHFIDLLRTNMAHCGALRIDHVMALMRLWWCPRFSGRGGGAYVHYPVDDLFALLRLESRRNNCLVIGEDLGVVPPEVRGYLDSSAIFSNILFYFEKYDCHQFKRPQDYNPRALAMVANHDVPPLAAWWNGTDLQLRFQLGLILSEETLAEQQSWRSEEKTALLDWLTEQWLLPESWQGDQDGRSFDTELCAAIFRCCARSNSQLLSMQLEDLALLETPVNIPGTCTEYPNWRRKLPIDLPELLNSESTNVLLDGFSIERGDD